VNKNRVIKKLLVLTVWCLVIAGITTLLVAANRKKTEHVCKEVVISIKGSGEIFFIEEADIRKQLEKTSVGSLIKKPLGNISLASLEKSLEKNQWIRDAELYFDREDVLHVSVREREPVARVFTTGGASFYMDSSGHQMPLLDRGSVRVPVITGYINTKKLSAKDSALLNDVKQVAKFVAADPFWNAQIGQIDITAERKFELFPVIGDHIIRIGDAENIEEKMSRLLLFYKQVMSKTGFDKYSVVDVQYEGQVIGVNKGTVSAIDSIQLKKNIKELLERSTIQNVSDEMLPDAKPAAQPDLTQISMTTQNDSVSVKTNPIPAKRTDSERPIKESKPVDKLKEVTKTNAEPKAVMKKKH
jgi:cell division protein FtsQ